MPVTGNHLGMDLLISDVDHENRAYFDHLSRGELRLQRCTQDGLLRYPPTSRCPFCGNPDCIWDAVEARGTVYTYTEVHHAIQPAFSVHTPYMVLMVELDAQRAQPAEHDALRIMGNLATPDGQLATPDLVAQVGIGSRVRMVTAAAGDNLAIAHWALDEGAEQPAKPWRYPE